MRYVDSYEDVRPAIPSLATIDDHITRDLHYILRRFEDNLVVSLSAINFTDEDPPITSTDLNYGAGSSGKLCAGL